MVCGDTITTINVGKVVLQTTLNLSLGSIFNFMFWQHCAYVLVRFGHRTSWLGLGNVYWLKENFQYMFWCINLYLPKGWQSWLRCNPLGQLRPSMSRPLKLLVFATNRLRLLFFFLNVWQPYRNILHSDILCWSKVRSSLSPETHVWVWNTHLHIKTCK